MRTFSVRRMASSALRHGIASAVMYTTPFRAALLCAAGQNNEKKMIACCNDGTRPVIFKLERIDEGNEETA